MHYHLEIVMPPTEDVQTAVSQILEPFSRHRQDSSSPFWDWWEIGGRFADAKNGMNVTRFDQMPADFQCFRLIIGMQWDGSLEAAFMLSREFWNGITFQNAAWNGNIVEGLELHANRLKMYSDEYRRGATPQPDWLVVTVDYHS